MGQYDTSSDDRRSCLVLPERIEQGTPDRISKGECWLIKRREKNMNQTQMAEALGLSRYTYAQMESCMEEGDRYFSELKPHEKCMIRRKRSGMRQSELASKIGMTRYWVMLMETGQKPCEKLEAFWNGR